MARIRQGVLEPNVQVKVEQITPVVSQIDGKNGESRTRFRRIMLDSLADQQHPGLDLSIAPTFTLTLTIALRNDACM
jgi:LDH2 family malate/lactate/ureidoglycolate dehydrogenase